MLSKRDVGWLNSALRAAKSHDSGGHYALAALVIQGGRVISRGFNSYLRPAAPKSPLYDYHGVHAELAALIDLLSGERRLKGATMYVAGVSKAGNTLHTTKPCPVCQELLQRAGGAVDRVVFFEEGEPNEMVI